MKTVKSTVLALVSLTALTACGASQPSAAAPPAADPTQAEPSPELEPVEEAAPPETEAKKQVEVNLESRSGSKLSGKAVFSETDNGVRVAVTVENVSPGTHATHIHEKGDCSAPDGSSAGSHFNPEGHEHGLPTKTPRHLGDLGNIMVGEDGKGSHEIEIAGANLTPGDPKSFLERAIIVHEKEDDGGQPVGNAGGRIGCGVIK